MIQQDQHTIHCPKFFLPPLFGWYFDNNNYFCVQTRFINWYKNVQIMSWNVPSFASGFNIEPEWYLWYCARYSVWVPNCETIETYPITNLRKKFVFVHESLFVNKDTRILNFYFYWFQLYFFSYVCAFWLNNYKKMREEKHGTN